jgi:hypothetical protein
MSITLLFYENPENFAEALPPPAAAFVIKVIESADPGDMATRVAAALADVVTQNVLIAAAFPDEPDLVLTLADVEFAGGGDGHAFVTTLVFVPASLNSVGEIIGFEALDLVPENFQFFFGLASEQDALGTAITDTITRAAGPLAGEMLFQFFAGAAKGTRFMFGCGGIVEGVGPQFSRAFDGDGAAPSPMALRLAGMRTAAASRSSALLARKASAKKQ